MVCMGNICRSPTAEAVLRQKAHNAGIGLHIESAGTLALHKGNKPDSRSVDTAQRRGYSFKGQRSRPVENSDFERFDLILAMDDDNMRELLIRCPAALRDKVKLLLSYADSNAASELSNEVPDPYYGGKKGFELVLELIEQGCDGLLSELRAAR